MKIYKTNEEVKKDIVNGVLDCKGDVKFECNVDIEASINARDINAWNINARDINAEDINALDINAWNINAGDINSLDINALDINAWNINAGNINAGNIKYNAFCNVYNSIKCKSIKAKREIHNKPVCLEGKLEIIENLQAKK